MELGCSRVSKLQMGHGYCAEHCLCLHQIDNDYVYDPFRCDVCLAFIREKFQGATVVDHIKSAMTEMESHVKKLRRYLEGLEGSYHLKFSKFVDEVRKKARAKVVDTDFFRDMSVSAEHPVVFDDQDDQVSIPSLASGPSKSPRPGKPASPSKTMKEDVASLKGQMARMESVLMKLVELPALQANSSAHALQVAEGSSRYETGDGRARSKEPLHGT